MGCNHLFRKDYKVRKHVRIMIGKKLIKIVPVYEVVEQIDTDSYRIGYDNYQGTMGYWVIKDQWGNRKIVKDFSEYEEVS